MQNIEIFERYETLRIADLVAKTAKVNMKDTLRVLIAIELIKEYTGKTFETVFDNVMEQMDGLPATANQQQACNDAYREMMEHAQEEDYCQRLLDIKESVSRN